MKIIRKIAKALKEILTAILPIIAHHKFKLIAKVLLAICTAIEEWKKTPEGEKAWFSLKKQIISKTEAAGIRQVLDAFLAEKKEEVSGKTS